MTTYTHTAEQHAQLLTLRLQLLDSPNQNDHKAKMHALMAKGSL